MRRSESGVESVTKPRPIGGSKTWTPPGKPCRGQYTLGLQTNWASYVALLNAFVLVVAGVGFAPCLKHPCGLARRVGEEVGARSRRVKVEARRVVRQRGSQE